MYACIENEIYVLIWIGFPMLGFFFIYLSL